MIASAPEFGTITFACGGCGRVKTFPFLDKKGLLIPDLVRSLAPQCSCGSMMEVGEITRAQGCGEKEEVTG